MELQVPYCICAKIQKKSILRRQKIRDKRNNTPVMPMERSVDNRGRSMSRPYTYIGEHPAQNERFGIYGIFKRKKCTINISEVWKYEICIPKPRILV